MDFYSAEPSSGYVPCSHGPQSPLPLVGPPATHQKEATMKGRTAAA